MSFCDEIRQAVADCGMSRYRICKELGLDQGKCPFMAGMVLMRPENLNKLAAFLDLHVVKGKGQ